VPGTDSVALLGAAGNGDRAALAKLLSLVERGGQAARAIGRQVGGATGAYTVGITGASGSGKSTLTSAVLGVVRAEDQRIAVLAIDPSSPFSGGAILGDRVRMGQHDLDDGVFIRSMATRGHLGGLAVAAPEAVRVLAAAGFEWVLVETVGVGQVEVEVAEQADTTVVVVNPGWGDAVQAAKAGLMEIADVFVVNKADRGDAGATVRDLDRMLDMAGRTSWRPPVLRSVATTGDGVEAVWAAVGEHRSHLEASGGLVERRRRRAAEEITRLVAARLMEEARGITSGDRAHELAVAVAAGDLDPWTASEQLLTPRQ
jgi:LAO/AO transport system kinase